jgi:hypothetical protein
VTADMVAGMLASLTELDWTGNLVANAAPQSGTFDERVGNPFGRLKALDDSKTAARRLAAGDEGALPGHLRQGPPTHRLFIVNDENHWEIARSY